MCHENETTKLLDLTVPDGYTDLATMEVGDAKGDGSAPSCTEKLVTAGEVWQRSVPPSILAVVLFLFDAGLLSILVYHRAKIH